MKKVYSLITLFLICTLTTEAQNFFEKDYVNQGDAWGGFNVQQTFDNGFITFVDKNDYPYGNLLKTDEFGDSLWLKPVLFLDSSGQFDDIINTSDSGIIMVGD